MEATAILPVLKKKLAFLSGKTNTHYNICTGGGTTDVCSVIGCFPVCNFASFRGERPAQWSDPEHPAQLRSDQHGRAQRHTGLPAQHSQVRSHQSDATSGHCVFVFIFFPFCFLFLNRHDWLGTSMYKLVKIKSDVTGQLSEEASHYFLVSLHSALPSCHLYF